MRKLICSKANDTAKPISKEFYFDNDAFGNMPLKDQDKYRLAICAHFMADHDEHTSLSGSPKVAHDSNGYYAIRRVVIDGNTCKVFAVLPSGYEESNFKINDSETVTVNSESAPDTIVSTGNSHEADNIALGLLQKVYEQSDQKVAEFDAKQAEEKMKNKKGTLLISFSPLPSSVESNASLAKDDGLSTYNLRQAKTHLDIELARVLSMTLVDFSASSLSKSPKKSTRSKITFDSGAAVRERSYDKIKKFDVEEMHNNDAQANAKLNDFLAKIKQTTEKLINDKKGELREKYQRQLTEKCDTYLNQINQAKCNIEFFKKTFLWAIYKSAFEIFDSQDNEFSNIQKYINKQFADFGIELTNRGDFIPSLQDFYRNFDEISAQDMITKTKNLLKNCDNPLLTTLKNNLKQLNNPHNPTKPQVSFLNSEKVETNELFVDVSFINKQEKDIEIAQAALKNACDIPYREIQKESSDFLIDIGDEMPRKIKYFQELEAFISRSRELIPTIDDVLTKMKTIKSHHGFGNDAHKSLINVKYSLANENVNYTNGKSILNSIEKKSIEGILQNNCDELTEKFDYKQKVQAAIKPVERMSTYTKAENAILEFLDKTVPAYDEIKAQSKEVAKLKKSFSDSILRDIVDEVCSLEKQVITPQKQRDFININKLIKTIKDNVKDSDELISREPKVAESSSTYTMLDDNLMKIQTNTLALNRLVTELTLSDDLRLQITKISGLIASVKKTKEILTQLDQSQAEAEKNLALLKNEKTNQEEIARLNVILEKGKNLFIVAKQSLNSNKANSSQSFMDKSKSYEEAFNVFDGYQKEVFNIFDEVKEAAKLELKKQEEAKREQEAKRLAEEKAMREKAEKQAAEEEARKRAEEEAKERAEYEAKMKEEEKIRMNEAEEVARKEKDEAERQKIEEKIKRQAEEEKKQTAEKARRLAEAEEEAKIKAEIKAEKEVEIPKVQLKEIKETEVELTTEAEKVGERKEKEPLEEGFHSDREEVENETPEKGRVLDEEDQDSKESRDTRTILLQEIAAEIMKSAYWNKKVCCRGKQAKGSKIAVPHGIAEMQDVVTTYQEITESNAGELLEALFKIADTSSKRSSKRFGFFNVRNKATSDFYKKIISIRGDMDQLYSKNKTVK